MKSSIEQTSIKTSIIASLLRLRPRFLAVLAGLALIAISTVHAQTINVLENPDWGPTTPGGSDGGRDWTYTIAPDAGGNAGYDGAQQFTDLYDLGNPPVTDGSLGLLLVNVPGNPVSAGAPEFQYGASAWMTASAGQTWTGGGYFLGASSTLNGSQEGIAVLVFADANYNVLGETTNVVINAGLQGGPTYGYTNGTVTGVAPAGTVHVQLQLGLFDPGGNTASTIWVTQASLTSPGIAPVWVDSPVTSAQKFQVVPLKVTISPGYNSSSPVTVTLNDSDTNIISLPGSVNGNRTVTFAAGATNVQTISVQALGLGTSTFAVSGSNLSGDSLPLTGTPINIVDNPNFAPSTPGANDGARHWTLTIGPDDAANNNGIIGSYDGVLQYTDYYDLSYPGSTDGSDGMLIVNVPGNSTPEFQYGASDWYTAKAGQTWTGGAYFYSYSLNGLQEGIEVILFADANHNVLGGTTNVVVTAGLESGPNNNFTNGTVTSVAPAGTVYVQLQLGLFDPGGNAGAEVWITQGSLTSPGIASVWIDRYSIGQPGQIPLTLTIPQGMNFLNSVSVTVSNSNPSVMNLPGSVGSVLTVNFASGTSNVQTVLADALSSGMATFSTGGTNFSGMSMTVSDTNLTNSFARVLFAQYAPGLAIDGTGNAWSNLTSSTFYMDTSANNSGLPGNLGVNIRYAWDYTNLYILVAENTNLYTAAFAAEADNPADYQAAFYNFDCIAFWIDLTDTTGETINGQTIVKNNADLQPWFAFSSGAISNMYYCRINNTLSENLAPLANCLDLTSGDFADHNRKIEVAIPWADIASNVDPSVQPGGNVATHLMPGMKFGSEPLLIYNNSAAQSFVGAGNIANPPSGVDTNSVDFELTVGNTAPMGFTGTIQSGQFVLSWPVGVLGTLQTSPVLGAGANWTDLGPATVVGYYNEVTQPLSAAKAFYRLKAQ